MDRVYTSGASVTPVAAPASPSSGYPTAGNPGVGTPATKPGAYWFQMITEELRALLVAAGLTPDHTNMGQVALAVQTIANANGARSKIQPISATVAANALTATISGGSFDFRNTTLSSGAINTRTFGAISVVAPNGATLGTVNGQQGRIAVLAIDNAVTVEAALINVAGGVSLDESGLISTTAISAASTSASVAYSTTARSSVPYRVAGYIEITEAAAGVWATAPSLVQGSGGQAIGSMQSLGYGQSWQAVTRTSGTTYYNITGRPIILSANVGVSSAGSITVAGQLVAQAGTSSTQSGTPMSAVIPPGASYVLTHAGLVSGPFELR